jgi:hypothetical protein
MLTAPLSDMPGLVTNQLLASLALLVDRRICRRHRDACVRWCLERVVHLGRNVRIQYKRVTHRNVWARTWLKRISR